MSAYEDEWDEQVDGWVLNLVSVTRQVPFWTSAPRWHRRTVAEFCAALQAATEGLEECTVDAADFHDSVRVFVTGLRDPSPEDVADRERREHMAWISAKTRYFQDLGRWEES